MEDEFDYYENLADVSPSGEPERGNFKSLEELNSYREITPYSIQNSDGLYKIMYDSVISSLKIIPESPTRVRILLNHWKWDSNFLYDSYFSADDVGVIYQKANLSHPPDEQMESSSLPESQFRECQICFSLHLNTSFVHFACEHSFCIECVKSYLSSKIENFGGEEKIECLEASCKCVIEDDQVIGIMDDEQGKLYKNYISTNFVQFHNLMTFCPYAGCDKVVVLNSGPVNWQPINCSCGNTFCFSCSQQWHGPLSCHLLKMWRKKYTEDSQNLKWISVNTKNCPKCDSSIEKNGGCNVMTCRKADCRHVFCWNCLQPMRNHGHENGADYCNRFNNEEEGGDGAMTKAQLLKRYHFYYDRHQNHFNSLKAEKSIKNDRDNLLKEMEPALCQENAIKPIRQEFINCFDKAMEVLRNCRQVLMYTYIFAYYLKETNESRIFETNQADLERATEALSGLLERDIIQQTVKFDSDLNIKLKNIYFYCETRCKVLLKHVYEGYDEDYWSYINDD